MLSACEYRSSSDWQQLHERVMHLAYVILSDCTQFVDFKQAFAHSMLLSPPICISSASYNDICI